MGQWLYLDLNSFFASCEQQENPGLRGKPVAVVPMMADTTFCIAASYEAKAFGVKTGTRVGDAKKMCPGLKLITANHQLYVKYHHKMLEAVDTCVPIHSVCSIDEIACELTGSQIRYEVAAQLVQKIKCALREIVGSEIKGSIGIGPSMLLSKVAADMKKPDGFTILKKEELPQALYPLKLTDIPGIGRRMEARLHQKSIFTMQDLLNKNESEMRGLWAGVPGARMYRLLRGEDLAIPAYFHGNDDPQSISHQHVIPPKLRNFHDGLIIAHKLLSKVGVRLRQAQMKAGRLSLYVRSAGTERGERSMRFQATQDTSFFIKQVSQMYDEIAIRKPMKISVVVSDLSSLENEQLSLFEDQKKNHLFRITDEINQKFGRNTLYVGSLHNNLSTAPTRIAFSRIPDLDEV